MKLSILISLLLLIGAPLKAQTPRSTEWLYELKPASSQLGCDWGYQDMEGNWVIEPQFESAQKFDLDSTAIVSIGGRYGILHVDGHFALECKYAYVERVLKFRQRDTSRPQRIDLFYSPNTKQDGLYQIVKPDSSQNLFNARTGNWLKLDTTDRFSPFMYNGRLVIKTEKGQKLAWPDKILHKKAYQHLQPITGTLWVYKDKNGLCGLLTENGEEICPPQFESIANYFINGLLPYFEEDQVGYIDSFGQIVYKAKWDSSSFEGSLIRGESSPQRMYQPARLVSKQSNKTNYFLTTQQLLLNKQRDSYQIISNDWDCRIYALRQNGKWSLVNDSLRRLSTYYYDCIEINPYTTNSFWKALVLRRGDSLDAYLIKYNGRCGVPELCFTYPKKAKFNFHEYSVTYQGKIYYHSRETNELLVVSETPLNKVLYDNGSKSGKWMWLSEQNNKYGLIEIGGKEVLPCVFDTIMLGKRNRQEWGSIVVKDEQAYRLNPWLDGREVKVNHYGFDPIILNNTFHAVIDESNSLVFTSHNTIVHLEDEFYLSNGLVYSTSSKRYFATRTSEKEFKIINELVVELSGVLYKRNGDPLFEGYFEIRQHKKDYFYGYKDNKKLCLLSSWGELIMEFPDTVFGFYNYQPSKGLIFLECPRNKEYLNSHYTYWKLCQFPSLKPVAAIEQDKFAKPFTIGYGLQTFVLEGGLNLGMIDQKLEIVHKPKYSQILVQGNCYFIMNKKNKWLLADSSGQLLIDTPCDEMTVVRDGQVVFSRHDKIYVYKLGETPICINDIKSENRLYGIIKTFDRDVLKLSQISTYIPHPENRLVWWRHHISEVVFNYQIRSDINEELKSEKIWSHSPIKKLCAAGRNTQNFSKYGKTIFKPNPRVYSSQITKHIRIVGHTDSTITARTELKTNGKVSHIKVVTYSFANNQLFEIKEKGFLNLEDVLKLTEENKSQLETMALAYLAQHPELKLKCSKTGIYYPQITKTCNLTDTELVFYNIVSDGDSTQYLEWHIPIEEIRPMLKSEN